MPSISSLAETATLVGDPARANMLVALLDGRALTAAELARAAGITPPTASGHLARLTQAGLVAMVRQGRHHYHRLASPAVARMLETLMTVAAASDGMTIAARQAPVVVGPRDTALRRARLCYDHLAGQVAVAMADRMLERGHIEFSADGGAITREGTAFLRTLGVECDAARGHGRQVFCRPCLDWSERRPHVAGAIGAALCRGCLDRGWMHRGDGTRAVTITPAGQAALGRAFGREIVT